VCGKHRCHEPGGLARKVPIAAGAGVDALWRPQQKISIAKILRAKYGVRATDAKFFVRRT